jgi:tetratricopeptide (TPR) repeat protein
MSRSDAARMCRRAGGVLVHPADATVTLLVRGDDAEVVPEELRQLEIPIVDETALLNRVGLVDSGHDVSRLYTPAMLANMLGVSIAAVRRWIRKGYLQPACEVRRLAYFDFPEVAIGRRLAELVSHGVSLATIDKKMAELERQLPHVPRPLAELAVVVEGRNLYLQRNGEMAEPSGQRLLSFDDTSPADPSESSPIVALAMPTSDDTPEPDELRALALDLAERGEFDRAIELCRAVHLSGDASADDHLILAELLYQSGQPLAARERYYMALECDEDLVEARVSLGILLGELGQTDLAISALEGAIDQYPTFADAHFHLARLLEQQARATDARSHWREFLGLAPESPWADEARASLGDE